MGRSLKRCPNELCKSKDVYYQLDGKLNIHYIKCFNCGTKSRYFNDANSAINYWNDRDSEYSYKLLKKAYNKLLKSNLIQDINDYDSEVIEIMRIIKEYLDHEK